MSPEERAGVRVHLTVRRFRRNDVIGVRKYVQGVKCPRVLAVSSVAVSDA
jgi:hypothetical protein